MVSPSTLGLVVVVIVLVVGVLGIFLYLNRRLKRRREDILTQLANKPELVQDRAYNRLAMARREVAVVARTGSDVGRARDLIAQSQSAFDSQQYERSYELAQSAHEALVSSRQRAPLPPAPSTYRRATLGTPGSEAALPPSAAPAADTATLPSDTFSSYSTASPAASPPAPLPRNRAESHFELSLLDQDLETAQRTRPTAGTTLQAAALRDQCQAAFDRGDFTESFKLALRARRTLGGRIESLAPTPSTRPAASPTGGAPLDAEGAAEQTAAADRCPNCGYPVTASDAFCRGCGAQRTPTTCPNCGADRAPSDTFCGRCGTRYTATGISSPVR